jgi:hypothetical protein
MIAAIYARKSTRQNGVADSQKSVTCGGAMPVLIAVLLASACSAPRMTEPPADSARVYQSLPDEVSQLRLTEMCAAAARQFWKDGVYEKQHPGQVWGYFSHYNRRLRRCLVQTRLTTFGKGEAALTQDFVADAFEGIDIASASNIDRGDPSVLGDDVLSGTSNQVPHPRAWFKRLMVSKGDEMIAAIYARKSAAQNGVADEGRSVTRQIEHARWGEKGWAVAEEHIYADHGISGGHFANGPGFPRLMKRAEARPLFQLVMSQKSRLWREAIEAAYALKQLVTVGVRVLFYLEP